LEGREVMLGVSFSELVIIILIAVVLLKPKDLPYIIKGFKKVYHKVMQFKEEMRPYYGEIYKEVEEEVRYVLDDKGVAHEAYDISEWKERNRKATKKKKFS